VPNRCVLQFHSRERKTHQFYAATQRATQVGATNTFFDLFHWARRGT
jgi:hypothetical protein